MTYKISVEADTYDECVKLWELLHGVTPVADSDGWTKWGGGEKPPVSGDTRVFVKLRDGTTYKTPDPAEFWWGRDNKCNNWYHNDRDADIVAYRVVK